MSQKKDGETGKGEAKPVPSEPKAVVIIHSFNEKMGKGWVSVINGYEIREQLKKSGFTFQVPERSTARFWQKSVGSMDELIDTVAETIIMVMNKGLRFKISRPDNVEVLHRIVKRVAEKKMEQERAGQPKMVDDKEIIDSVLSLEI